MQSRTPPAQGFAARVRAHLRGDRYMVDAFPPATAEPDSKREPVAPVAAPAPPRAAEER